MPAYYLPEKSDLSSDRYWCIFIGHHHAVGVILPDEVEILDKEIKPNDSMTILEVAQTFINASATIKRVLSEDNSRLFELLVLERKIKALVDKHVVHFTHNEMWKDILIGWLVDGERATITDRIVKNTRILDLIKQIKSKKEIRSLNIEKAKQTPISDYVEFNRSDQARCLWHVDHTPSMKYYREQNKVWCFACNMGGDVIDVVMQINNLNFRQAVNMLTS